MTYDGKRDNQRPDKKEESRANGSPSQTETQTRKSVARKATAFERLPRVLSADVRSGELSFYEHSLLCFIIGDRNWQTGELRGTLGAMKENYDWPHADEHLRRTLVSLRDKGWIFYPMKSGQRHYTITLGPRYFSELGLPNFHQSSSETPLPEWSFPPPGVPGEAVPSPHTNWLGPRWKASPATSPKTETETETETETRDQGNIERVVRKIGVRYSVPR